MPIAYIETDPRATPVTYEVPFSLFTAQNQALQIGASLPQGTRILGVVVHKEVAFDANTISLGTGITTGTHSNIATAAELAATAAGVVLPAAWLASDGAAHLLLSGPRALHARLGTGSLPAGGLIRVTLLTWRLASRAVL